MTTPDGNAVGADIDPASIQNQPTDDGTVQQTAPVAADGTPVVQDPSTVGNAPAGVDPAAITEPAPAESFEKRLADGTGGGDWHMTEEDKALNRRYQELLKAGYDEVTAMNMARNATPETEQELIARRVAAQQEAAGNPALEPQALSQPGPTPGAPQGA